MRPQDQDSEIPVIFNHLKQCDFRGICYGTPSPVPIHKVEAAVDVDARTLLDTFCQTKLPFVKF